MEHIGTGHTDPDHRRSLTGRQFAAFGYVAVAPALSENARLAGTGRTTHCRAGRVGNPTDANHQDHGVDRGRAVDSARRSV